MQYAHWNKSLMNRQLSILKRIYEETEDDNVEEDITFLKEARRRTLMPFEFTGTFYEKFLEEIEAAKDNRPFLDDIAAFADLEPLLKRKLILDPEEIHIPIKDILEFLRYFYNSLDKEIATIFNSIYKDRKDNLMFSKERGTTYTIDSLEYSYINVGKENIITDYIGAIHEYGHAIADRIYCRNNYNDGYPFIELMPLFMELLAIDKLIEEFSKLKKELIHTKAINLDIQLQYATHIDMMVTYLYQIRPKQVPRNKRYAIIDMMHKLNTSKEEVLDILDVTTLERLSYLIPYMTSIELYYLYCKDPEKALHILKEIIIMPRRENYNKALMENGIYLNNNSKKYVLDINRELKNFRH